MDDMGDDVLILILSRLSLKEAVRTSVLSSRFNILCSKIHTVVEEAIMVSQDFLMPPPSSYIRRRVVDGIDVRIQSLSIGGCELLRGRNIRNTLEQFQWLDSLFLWRVRGMGPILYLRSDTISNLRLEELPRVQGVVLQMPSLLTLVYAGRMARIGFHPNPPIELSIASLDFRRNTEEGGVVALVPGSFADLLQHFRYVRQRFTLSTFFSGQMELELSDTVIVPFVDVPHLVLEMTYSSAHDYLGVLSILRRCTDLHSVTIRLLDRPPFHVQVLFSADYFTRPEEPEYTCKVRHIKFEAVRVAQYMFAQVSSFLHRITDLETLTLSSYSEDDRDSLFGWVDGWSEEGSFPAVVMIVR